MLQHISLKLFQEQQQATEIRIKYEFIKYI